MNGGGKMKTSKISASCENYLEALFIIAAKKGTVRCVDLAEFLGFTKPSVSRAVALLEKGKYLTRGKEGNLLLTESGHEIAKMTYEKHRFLKAGLMKAGVDRKLADKEADEMKHTISDESFRKLKMIAGRREAHEA